MKIKEKKWRNTASKCDTVFMCPFVPICNEYAQKLDDAAARNDLEATQVLLAEAKKILQEHDEPAYAALYYAVGTSLAFIKDNLIKALDSPDAAYTEKNVIDIHHESIWYLRHALKLTLSEELEHTEYLPFIKGLLCILYVNLGNAMEFCGRKASAIMYYRQALAIDPTFGMALGNIGKALEHYAGLTEDLGHRAVFLNYAFHYYDKASSDCNPMTYQQAKDAFAMAKRQLIDLYGEDRLKRHLDFNKYSLGKGEEKIYREWCLANHLFLNPLNDLPDMQTAFATDSLKIGSIVTSAKHNAIPFVFEMLNQIKQEFIYARYLLFETQHCKLTGHYADKDTHLDDMLNYGSYSIRLEKLKTAYRTLYSLFDRSAFLLNAYLGLGIPETNVSFSHIFRNPKIQQLANDNIAILALRWINKDFMDVKGIEDSAHTKKLRDIRNALEHKFVTIHTMLAGDEIKMGDDYIRRITEDSLFEFTYELIRMMREVIIELTIAVYIEERKKYNPSNNKVKLSVIEYPDEFKL